MEALTKGAALQNTEGAAMPNAFRIVTKKKPSEELYNDFKKSINIKLLCPKQKLNLPLYLKRKDIKL